MSKDVSEHWSVGVLAEPCTPLLHLSIAPGFEIDI
jgi:hypothetical protein